VGRLNHNQKCENCTLAVPVVGHLPIQSREGKVRKVPGNGGGSPNLRHTAATTQLEASPQHPNDLGRSDKGVLIMSKTVKLNSAHRGNVS